jgi:hypothetical protein
MYNEKKRSSKEKHLGDVIDKLLKAYNLEDKMKELDLLEAWPDLMGKAVAHRTKSIEIKNQKLLLKIDSSVMREQLHIGKQVIILRVNEFMGKEVIRDVWFS